MYDQEENPDRLSDFSQQPKLISQTFENRDRERHRLLVDLSRSGEFEFNSTSMLNMQVVVESEAELLSSCNSEVPPQ